MMTINSRFKMFQLKSMVSKKQFGSMVLNKINDMEQKDH